MSTHRRMSLRTVATLAAAMLMACTGEPAAPPTPTPSLTPTLTPTPSMSPAPRFSTARALATIERLSTDAPRREASSGSYRRAATIVVRAFEGLGYEVTRQRFAVPAGTCDGIEVPAGNSQNVVATSPGFDPSKPHLVVGGHLDTVPDTPGANDNASGVAVILELARLATLEAPRVPIVWVAFGAEERRRGPGLNAYSLGARDYIRRMTTAQRRSLKGFVNIDMVGIGSSVKVVGRGRITAELFAAARRISVPAVVHAAVRQGFSDHVRFQAAGYSTGWLWAGDSDTLHTPRDRPSVIDDAEVGRIGRTAWEMLRRFRL